MRVSRVMSRREYENFLKGKTIRPVKKYDWTEDSDVRKHPNFKDGAVFFFPVDAREVDSHYLYKMQVVAGCHLPGLSVQGRDRVLAVFEINRKYLEMGKARITGFYGDAYGTFIREAYAHFYNKKNAKLLYADTAFEEHTAQYNFEMDSFDPGEIDDWDD